MGRRIIFLHGKPQGQQFVQDVLQEPSLHTREFGLCSHTVSSYSCQPSCTPQHWGNEGCPTSSFKVPYKLLKANTLLSFIYKELEVTV